MSTKPPQVLTRRANGVSQTPPNKPNESAQTKGNKEGNAPRSGGRGRSSNEKPSETSKGHDESEKPRPARAKAQNDGGKLLIRRLPPGMTQTEFVTILGPQWEVNKGKVDWFSYAHGKVSNDPSKPSRPSRSYLHLIRKDDIMALSEAVQSATWEDAKSTFTNPSLVGPPSLDFAVYKKVPNSKKRTDARQGTIDQDPEFMAFLEGLANPVPLRESIEADYADDAAKTETKITTTPLIEYLKEKKANKGKDGAGKNAKHGRDGGKGKGGSKDDDHSKKNGKDSKTDKSERPAKEKVKILTKKAATEQAAEAAKNAASQMNAAKAADASEAPKNRRAGIAAAARLLQRDLGLSPGSAHRRARQDAAKSDADPKSTTTKETVTALNEVSDNTVAQTTEAAPQKPKSRPSTPTTAKAQPVGRRARGGKNADKGKSTDDAPAKAAPTKPPVILKKKDVEAEVPPSTAEPSATPQQGPGSKSTTNALTAGKGASAKSAPQQKKATAVAADGTRAFIKHANPSQGVTEALLKQTLGSFGTITFIEMDKRKGFAYVDFGDRDSLTKAIAASPVTIGQGAVQILERKEKKAAAVPTGGAATASTASEKSSSNRGRRGRGGGGGKGSGATNGQAAPALAATNVGSG